MTKLNALVGRFRFIGKEDARTHYQTGQVYRLTVRDGNDWMIHRIFGSTSKLGIEYPYYCPYGSWEKFWENWVAV